MEHKIYIKGRKQTLIHDTTNIDKATRFKRNIMTGKCFPNIASFFLVFLKRD